MYEPAKTYKNSGGFNFCFLLAGSSSRRLEFSGVFFFLFWSAMIVPAKLDLSRISDPILSFDAEYSRETRIFEPKT